MGWLMLAMIGVATAGALWLAGVARSLWTLLGAALMLGAAGFAWQGRYVGLPGHPVATAARPVTIVPEIVALRGDLLGRFTGDGAYLIASDALMRGGNRDSGARVVLMGLNRYPRSVTLWTGLGTAMAQRDGAVSPAAKFAFDQAMRIAPQHPAPFFFQGLAYVEAGDFRRARPYWARAVALSPTGAAYRREIAGRLALLDLVIARTDAPTGG